MSKAMLVLSILARTVALCLHTLELMMLVRAVLSWFPPASGRPGPIRAFIITVTELVIAPVRAFLSRFDFVQRSPIDISFLVTYLLISTVSTFLPLL